MIKILNYETKINASKQKVWSVLWSEDTYPVWAAVFAEGSMATSSWEEGSSILFTDGNNSGMYSTIEKKMMNTQMTFKHIGMLKDGVKLPLDADSEQWSGSMEDYQLEEHNGITDLKVQLISTEVFASYLEDKFTDALQKIKELSEQS